MEKSYIQKITPFIDNMRIGSDESEQPSVNLFKLKEDTYLFEEIVFDTSKTPNVKDFELVDGGTPKHAVLFSGSLHFDGSQEEGNEDVVALQDYSNAQLDEHTILPDNSFTIGWGEGGMFPIYISNQELLDVFKIELPEIYTEDMKVGWQGSNLRESISEEYQSFIKEGATYEIKEIDSTNEEIWNGILVGASVDK